MFKAFPREACVCARGRLAWRRSQMSAQEGLSQSMRAKRVWVGPALEGAGPSCAPDSCHLLVRPPTVSGPRHRRSGERGFPWPHPKPRLWPIGTEGPQAPEGGASAFARPGVLGPQRSLLVFLGTAWNPWGAPCTCPKGVARLASS